MRKMLNEWRKFLDEGSERDKWAFNPGGDEPLTRGEKRGPSSHSSMGDPEPLWIQAVRYAVGVLEAMKSTHMDEPTLVAKVAEKMVMDPETVRQALATSAAAESLRKKGVMLGDDKTYTYNKPGKDLGV